MYPKAIDVGLYVCFSLNHTRQQAHAQIRIARPSDPDHRNHPPHARSNEDLRSRPKPGAFVGTQAKCATQVREPDTNHTKVRSGQDRYHQVTLPSDYQA